LKEEALDRTLWRTGFGRVSGTVLRHTTELMNCTVKPFAVRCSHFCL